MYIPQHSGIVRLQHTECCECYSFHIRLPTNGIGYIPTQFHISRQVRHDKSGRTEPHTTLHQIAVLQNGSKQHAQYKGNTRKLHKQQSPLPRTLVFRITAENLCHGDAGIHISRQNTCHQKKQQYRQYRHIHVLHSEYISQTGTNHILNNVTEQVHQQHTTAHRHQHNQSRFPHEQT